MMIETEIFDGGGEAPDLTHLDAGGSESRQLVDELWMETTDRHEPQPSRPRKRKRAVVAINESSNEIIETTNTVTCASRSKRITNREPPNTNIGYMDYFKYGKIVIDLTKYKLPELKRVARFNYLKVGGNKGELLERIQLFFICNLFATKIQACVRRHFVRQMCKIRGPAENDIKKCVNETDFYTLEPLAEIPRQEFFSYSDIDGFMYGFNINSFVYLLKMKRLAMVNPYNRNDIPRNVIMNAICLYSYMIMYMSHHIHEKDDLVHENMLWMNSLWKFIIPIRTRRRRLPPTILSARPGTPPLTNRNNRLSEPGTPIRTGRIQIRVPPAPAVEGSIPQPPAIRRVREFPFFAQNVFDDIFHSDSDSDSEIFRPSPNRRTIGRHIREGIDRSIAVPIHENVTIRPDRLGMNHTEDANPDDRRSRGFGRDAEEQEVRRSSSLNTLDTLDSSIDIQTERRTETPIPPLDASLDGEDTNMNTRMETASILLDLLNRVEDANPDDRRSRGFGMDAEEPEVRRLSDQERPSTPPPRTTTLPSPPSFSPPNVGRGSANTRDIADHINETNRKLQTIRTNTIQVRIREVFMEMDQLGNYTEIRWFQSLNKMRYYVLYGNLYENWRHRSRLSPHMKSRICPIGDPFQSTMPNPTSLDDITEAQLVDRCITVMENMIYTAYDIEDRKLGAMHVLTAMTAVSEDARRALPWLFEYMYD